MNAKRVLAVDDEARYLRLMRLNLEASGYSFVGVNSGEEALDLLVRGGFDLVLLDVRMPGMDGFELLRDLREISDVPVIFVTALGEEADKVRGLKLGADDYLTKPFGAPELLARVEAVLRRYQGSGADPVVAVGDLRIDLNQRRVFHGADEIRLSRTEFRLLACLVRHLGKVVPQDQLIHEVWGHAYDEGFEGLRVYVYRLRHKLEIDPEQPSLLQTFPGVGYVLQPPVSTAR
ncbi:MAG: response regulator transcription factor [Chloroflexota bacterium]